MSDCGCEGLPMDDSASAASSMEVTDRIASLEQRVQMQEDEIQLLKSALADVVRRLSISEEQNTMTNRRGPTKAVNPAVMKRSPSSESNVGKPARPMMAALPLRPMVNNGTVLPKKSGGTLPSLSSSRKDAAATATKSTVRRTNSNETMSTLTRKDSGDSKSNRTRAGSTGSNSNGKRASESKLKEPVFNTGMRRVTHCKVTVQIYLSRPSKRIGTAEAPKSSVASVSGRSSAPHTAPDSKNAPDKSVRSTGVRKTPTFTIPLKKSVSHTPLDTPNYRSPVKSPSQYFQICY